MLHRRKSVATTVLQPMMMNIPFMAGIVGQSVLTIPMATATNQGIKRDKGISEDKNPPMVVIHMVPEEAMEADEIMMAVEMANIILNKLK
jgi:hypothetical protein